MSRLSALEKHLRLPPWLSVVVLLAGSAIIGRAGLLGDLSPEDRSQVLDGGRVFVGEPVDGCPWPRANIYRFVEAQPEEVMAVFFDFASAAKFVPNVRSSVVTKELDPWRLEVDYELRIPLLPNEHYTVLNTLANRDGRLSVEWVTLRSRIIQSSEGDFVVEPYRSGSIVRYRNLVHPGSNMAGVLRGPAMNQVERTVEAIIKRVLDQKTTNPDDLRRQVKQLHNAVAALP